MAKTAWHWDFTPESTACCFWFARNKERDRWEERWRRCRVWLVHCSGCVFGPCRCGFCIELQILVLILSSFSFLSQHRKSPVRNICIVLRNYTSNFRSQEMQPYSNPIYGDISSTATFKFTLVRMYSKVAEGSNILANWMPIHSTMPSLISFSAPIMSRVFGCSLRINNQTGKITHVQYQPFLTAHRKMDNYHPYSNSS